MVKMYLKTKNEIPSYSVSKVIAQTYTETDTQTDPTVMIKYLHTWMLKIKYQKPQYLQISTIGYGVLIPGTNVFNSV